LVIAKFVPGLAIIAPPLAGALKIGWVKFFVLSTASAVLWVGSALVLGTLFDTQIESILRRIDDVGSVLAIVGALLLVAYVAYKWWQRARFYDSLRMARISVGELYELMQAGANPVIVDVRSATARALDPQWIPGALQIPLDDVAHHVKDLPRDRDIILYCACPSEASAARVARILMNHGFKKVRPLHGGLDAWLAAGYAVVRIAAPEAIQPATTL
jgi:rhodanese-related sulfurtransferase